MGKFGRLLCKECKKVFCPEIQEQTKCYACLLDQKERNIKNAYWSLNPNSKEKECIECGQKFISVHSKHCSSACIRKMQSKNLGKLRKKQIIKNSKGKIKSKIIQHNEGWIKGNNKNKRKKIPLDVLNKIMEKKRVWDNKGWDHYLRGRKWDRI